MAKIKKKSPEEKVQAPAATATPKPSGKVKKTIYKKHIKKDTTKVALPNRPELISANWKAMMTGIKKNKKMKRDSKAFERRFFIISLP